MMTSKEQAIFEIRLKKNSVVRELLDNCTAKDEQQWGAVAGIIKGMGESIDGHNLFHGWKGGGLFGDDGVELRKNTKAWGGAVAIDGGIDAIKAMFNCSSESPESNCILIGRSVGGFSNTALTPEKLTLQQLSKTLSAIDKGTKDGSYFCRASGTYRSNKTLSNTANILILDGDSRIDSDSGEIIAGAPDPELIHKYLTSQFISHIIYSSFSNGEKGEDYYKYRVIIFIDYTREQLPLLLEHYHELLHNEGLLLVNVRENRTWAQPWYFPRTTADRAHLFKHFEYFEGNIQIASKIIANYKKAHPELIKEPKPKAAVQTPRLVNASESNVNPIKLFNKHWRSPVNYLMTQGYTYKGTRLVPPHKADTATAGVYVCLNCVDGIERIYSHHGNDPLNDGYPHDSFDCFKILEHSSNEIAALKAVGQIFTIDGETLEKHNQREHVKKSKTPVSFDGMEVET